MNYALSVRRHLVLGLLTLLLLVGGFGGWAVFSQLSGAIIANGNVEVDQNRQIVQHPDGGVVAAIEVEEGELVEAGQILIRLDPTLLRSELAIVENQLFEILARRGRLEAERDEAQSVTFPPDLVSAAASSEEVRDLMEGQARLFEARNETMAREGEQLEKRRVQIETQVEGIEAQQESLDQQIDLIEQELAKQQDLFDRGLAPATVVLELQRELAALTGRRGELTARKGEAEERITEIGIEVLKLSTTRREDAISTLRDLRTRELELSEKRRSLREQLSRLDIRAPASGVVYGKTIFTPRSVIRPADPLMYLIPQDRPLVITAQVEPTDVDEVFLGQDVILRFSAFDSRSTPELTGTVVQLSADAFVDEQAGRTYYRAEIRLPEAELARLPEGLTLIPGMPVQAFIRTADRSPLTYLVQPLSDYFTRAFRES